MLEARTGRTVGGQPFTQHTDKLVIDDEDMYSNTVTESDLWVKSRSFFSLICGMFMSSTLEASVFLGKNYSENLRSIKNKWNNLTMKQMFDISEKLIVGQSDEIYGVTPIHREDSSWTHLSLVGDEEVINLQHAKVHVFSDSVLCFGKMNQNPESNSVWDDKLTWFKSSTQYRTLDTIDGEPIEFVWISKVW